MTKRSTRTRRARLAGVAAFAVTTAALVSSTPAGAANPTPGSPPSAVTDHVQTACNNTFAPTKFPLQYDIDSTVTAPVSGGNSLPIYPGDNFTVSFDVTAQLGADFLNGAYAQIGPAAVDITNNQVTIAALHGATGANVLVQDANTVTLPAPGRLVSATLATGNTTVTAAAGTFTAADVGANAYLPGKVPGGATVASVSPTGDSAVLSAAPTASGAVANLRIWAPLAAPVALHIGSASGTFTADSSLTAPYQASFQILGNSSSDNNGPPATPDSPMGNGNTVLGFTGSGAGVNVDASALQTYIATSLAGGLVTPLLVCMGGTWASAPAVPPATGTVYSAPLAAPSTTTGAGGFANVDVTALPIPTANVTSITGIGGAPAQFVNTAARADNVLHFGGGNWTPNATVDSVALCDSAGTNCSTSSLTSVTATIDGSGQLTGVATVDASAVQGAGRKLKVVSGSDSDARATLLILGTPTVSLSASSGPANGSINVTGTNWNPGSGATTVVVATDGTGTPLAAPVNVVINGTGGMTGTVSTPAGTAFIGVGDGNPAYPQPPSPLNPGSLAASAPFSINQNAQNCGSGSPLSGCTLDQSLYLNVSPGDFTWEQQTPFVVLNSTTTGTGCTEANRTTCTGLKLDGSTQTVTGSINQISIVDARGQGAGWSVTATMTDLVTGAGGANEVLPASSVTLDPDCVVTDGAAPAGNAAVTPGATGLLSNTTALGLCSAAPTHGGGKFTVDGDLSLSVPPSINAGLYQATLTLVAV